MQLARRVLLAATVPIALGACYRDRGAGATLENRPDDARAEAASADELAFLPLDAELVFGLDARQLFASPLWRHFEPRLRSEIGGSLRELEAACGFDPFATMRGVTLGLKASEPIDGVIVVRGLDRDRTMGCIQRALSPRARVSIERGVVTVSGDGPKDPPVLMTFAGRSTLVVATSRGRLDAALASGAPLRRSRAFLELWQLVDAKQAMWGIVNGTSSAFDALSSLGMRPRAILGSVGLAAGLSLTARVRLGTADEAAQLAQLAQTQVGMLKSMADRVDLGAEGADFTVRLDMTAAQLEAVAGLLMGAMGPGGMPNPLGGP